MFETSYRSLFSVDFVLLENREDVTSCVTCYVISNHTSFCYVDDSGNQMYLRVIAQLVLSDYSDVAERGQTLSNRRV